MPLGYRRIKDHDKTPPAPMFVRFSVPWSPLAYRKFAICIILLRWRQTLCTLITPTHCLHHPLATVLTVVTQVSITLWNAISPVRHEISSYILTSHSRHVLTIR